MMVMLGGEEMKKLCQHQGGVVEEDSYIKAMAKAEESIKRLTNQAPSKLSFNKMENGDALEQPRLEVEERGKMVASGVLDQISQEAGGTRERFQMMVVLMVNQAIWLRRRSGHED